MDERLLILGEIEDEVRRELNACRWKLKQISNEDIIDAAFGELGICLDVRNRSLAAKTMMSACSYLFHYAHGKENKPTKKENEAFKYHLKRLSERIWRFKEELRNNKEDNELMLLHQLLYMALKDPYRFFPEPENIPSYTFTKKEIEDEMKSIFLQGVGMKCTNAISRAIDLIDQRLDS